MPTPRSNYADRVARTEDRTRWEEDNRLVVNPWAFAAAAGLVLAVAALALLIAFL
jgi:hypothetical protein